jgi:hydroxymethylpyrimidine pyrophosphatase-like HAD family hydrolase
MLASDLDGTLIPPIRDRKRLDEVARFGEAVSRHEIELAYLTGRDHDLALRGIEKFGLPLPEFLVCDVGTSVYTRRADGSGYTLDHVFRSRVRDALGGEDRGSLLRALGPLRGLEPQGPEQQGEFKVSFFADEALVPALREQVPARLDRLPVPPKVVWSHDPYSGRTLLDLLPRGVAKHTALEHLRAERGYRQHEIVYAGDSGNDTDALLSGHPAIVVANAPADLKTELRTRAATAGIEQHLYFATAPYAGGVLEGCRHFGVL